MLKARPNQKMAIRSMNRIGNTTAASAISDPLLSRRKPGRAPENWEFISSKRHPRLAGSIKQDCNGCRNAKGNFRRLRIVDCQVLARKMKAEKGCGHAAQISESLP